MSSDSWDKIIEENGRRHMLNVEAGIRVLQSSSEQAPYPNRVHNLVVLVNKIQSAESVMLNQGCPPEREAELLVSAVTVRRELISEVDRTIWIPISDYNVSLHGGDIIARHHRIVTTCHPRLTDRGIEWYHGDLMVTGITHFIPMPRMPS